MMKARDESDWHQVYDLLVKEGGARDVPAERQPFVSHALAGELTEWRFCGHLGFGGKIWLNKHTGRLHVSCYREDESPKRLKIIEQVNAFLLNM